MSRDVEPRTDQIVRLNRERDTAQEELAAALVDLAAVRAELTDVRTALDARPTQDAYGAAFAAIWKHRGRCDTLRSDLAQLRIMADEAGEQWVSSWVDEVLEADDATREAPADRPVRSELDAAGRRVTELTTRCDALRATLGEIAAGVGDPWPKARAALKADDADRAATP